MGYELELETWNINPDNIIKKRTFNRRIISTITTIIIMSSIIKINFVFTVTVHSYAY